jgi:hypothetical protein
MGGWLVAHLVRDEGVAGSNPATPTSFLVAPIAYAASYAERNSRVIISRRRFTPIPQPLSEPRALTFAAGAARHARR